MAQRPSKRVLLIGWDGADWKMITPLLEQGQMPNLQRLIERGVMGNVASLTPMLSPILWTSIATGKHADQHGILGFAEPDGDSGRIRPVTSTSRSCKAIWNILSDQGMQAGVVNWFASQPAEPINGFVVTDRFPQPAGPPDKPWPAVAQSVHPADLLEEVCALRVHPAATTPQQVAPFVPRLAELNPREDKKLAELRTLLAQCASVQAATTYMMQTQDWDFLGVYYDAIDRFAHAFMEFHPPKMAHVSQQDFERYQDVMTGVYRFHDMMLGRLMQLAGDETVFILLSDHGFHCDHLRPEGSAEIKDGRPVAWHRQHGILIISGPGIKNDERVYGASLLDIAPTVLWLLGLATPRDMNGNALTQIAEGKLAEPQRVETYEENLTPATASELRRGAHIGTPSAKDGAECPSARCAPVCETSPLQDPWAIQQTLQRLADLGYIEPDASVEGIVLDRGRNLAQVYAATGRPQLAIAEYQKVLQRKPDDRGSKLAIASCRLQLNQLDECERIAKEVLGSSKHEDLTRRRGARGEELIDPSSSASSAPLRETSSCSDSPSADAPQAILYLGMISFQRGDTDRALAYLAEAEKAEPRLPGLHVQIGNVYLRRRRWKDAERAFRKALAIDPDNAEAHDGLGVTYRWQKRAADAVHEHMLSISLLHYRPQTHIHLGLALAEVGQIDWAIRAFHVALAQNPRLPLAHACLAQLYQRAKRDPAKAAEHRECARALGASTRGARREPKLTEVESQDCAVGASGRPLAQAS